jgi:hypothetical protein
MAACLVETPVPFILRAILPNLDTVTVLHVSEPLACIGGSIFEVNFSPLLKLGFINIVHIDAIHVIVLKLLIDNLAVSIAHVVLVLRVHLTQLGSDPLTSDDSPKPCLEADN